VLHQPLFLLPPLFLFPFTPKVSAIFSTLFSPSLIFLIAITYPEELSLPCIMDEDWDLFAIVRSCQSPTNTSTTGFPQTTTNTTSSSLLTSIVKEDRYDAFSFPNTVEPITNEFHELHQLFSPFNPTTTNTTTLSAPRINPNSPYFAEQESQQISDHLRIWPHLLPEPSTPSFNRIPDHQQQQQNQLQLLHKQEFHAPQNNSPTVSPNTQPQTPKSRKRYKLFSSIKFV